MRFLLAIIGYLAFATLLAQAVLMGYLWSSDRLNDEKMFQIVALVHDIDLDQATATTDEEARTETPPEEPSLAEVEKIRELALRNFEAKQNALDSGKSEYDHLLRQLTTASNRFDRLATELQERVELETDQLQQQNVASVVRDLESMKADQAKELLLLTLEQAGTSPENKIAAMDEVILLMNAMQRDILEAILKKFTEPDEMQRLHELHQRMLTGGEKLEALEDVQQQLQDRDYSL